MKPDNQTNQQGFTLVEILVALSIFAMVAVVSTMALLAITDVNAKSQSIQSAMDNLNAAVEDMSRTIRMGTIYKCKVLAADTSYLNSCANGGAGFQFITQDGTTTVYTFDTLANKGVITRSQNGGTPVPITSTDNINIDTTRSKFYLLFNSTTLQPRLLISITGTGTSASQSFPTNFTVQTTVSERMLVPQ